MRLSILLVLVLMWCLTSRDVQGMPVGKDDALVTMVTGALGGSDKDRAEAISMVLELLAAIDLPALCTTIADNSSPFTRLDDVIAVAARAYGVTPPVAVAAGHAETKKHGGQLAAEETEEEPMTQLPLKSAVKTEEAPHTPPEIPTNNVQHDSLPATSGNNAVEIPYKTATTGHQQDISVSRIRSSDSNTNADNNDNNKVLQVPYRTHSIHQKHLLDSTNVDSSNSRNIGPYDRYLTKIHPLPQEYPDDYYNFILPRNNNYDFLDINDDIVYDVAAADVSALASSPSWSPSSGSSPGSGMGQEEAASKLDAVAADASAVFFPDGLLAFSSLAADVQKQDVDKGLDDVIIIKGSESLKPESSPLHAESRRIIAEVESAADDGKENDEDYNVDATSTTLSPLKSDVIAAASANGINWNDVNATEHGEDDVTNGHDSSSLSPTEMQKAEDSQGSLTSMPGHTIEEIAVGHAERAETQQESLPSVSQNETTASGTTQSTENELVSDTHPDSPSTSTASSTSSAGITSTAAATTTTTTTTAGTTPPKTVPETETTVVEVSTPYVKAETETSTAGDQSSNDSTETSTAGDQPSNDSTETSTAGDQPSNNSIETSTAGDQPSNDSTETSTAGDQPSNDSTETSTAGDQPSNDSTETSTAGDQPSNDSTETSTAGDQPSNDSTETSTAGDQPSNDSTEKLVNSENSTSAEWEVAKNDNSTSTSAQWEAAKNDNSTSTSAQSKQNNTRANFTSLTPPLTVEDVKGRNRTNNEVIKAEVYNFLRGELLAADSDIAELDSLTSQSTSDVAFNSSTTLKNDNAVTNHTLSGYAIDDENETPVTTHAYLTQNADDASTMPLTTDFDVARNARMDKQRRHPNDSSTSFPTEEAESLLTTPGDGSMSAYAGEEERNSMSNRTVTGKVLVNAAAQLTTANLLNDSSALEAVDVMTTAAAGTESGAIVSAQNHTVATYNDTVAKNATYNDTQENNNGVELVGNGVQDTNMADNASSSVASSPSTSPPTSSSTSPSSSQTLNGTGADTDQITLTTNSSFKGETKGIGSKNASTEGTPTTTKETTTSLHRSSSTTLSTPLTTTTTTAISSIITLHPTTTDELSADDTTPADLSFEPRLKWWKPRLSHWAGNGNTKEREEKEQKAAGDQQQDDVSTAADNNVDASLFAPWTGTEVRDSWSDDLGVKVNSLAASTAQQRSRDALYSGLAMGRGFHDNANRNSHQLPFRSSVHTHNGLFNDYTHESRGDNYLSNVKYNINNNNDNSSPSFSVIHGEQDHTATTSPTAAPDSATTTARFLYVAVRSEAGEERLGDERQAGGERLGDERQAGGERLGAWGDERQESSRGEAADDSAASSSQATSPPLIPEDSLQRLSPFQRPHPYPNPFPPADAPRGVPSPNLGTLWGIRPHPTGSGFDPKLAPYRQFHDQFQKAAGPKYATPGATLLPGPLSSQGSDRGEDESGSEVSYGVKDNGAGEVSRSEVSRKVLELLGVQQKTLWSEDTRHLSAAAAAASQKGYACPGLFGYFGDIMDCSSFFICSWGVPYRFYCPARTLWNPAQSVCDWERNVDCASTKSA